MDFTDRVESVRAHQATSEREKQRTAAEYWLRVSQLLAEAGEQARDYLRKRDVPKTPVGHVDVRRGFFGNNDKERFVVDEMHWLVSSSHKLALDDNAQWRQLRHGQVFTGRTSSQTSNLIYESVWLVGSQVIDVDWFSRHGGTLHAMHPDDDLPLSLGAEGQLQIGHSSYSYRPFLDWLAERLASM